MKSPHPLCLVIHVLASSKSETLSDPAPAAPLRRRIQKVRSNSEKACTRSWYSEMSSVWGTGTSALLHARHVASLSWHLLTVSCDGRKVVGSTSRNSDIFSTSVSGWAWTNSMRSRAQISMSDWTYVGSDALGVTYFTSVSAKWSEYGLASVPMR